MTVQSDDRTVSGWQGSNLVGPFRLALPSSAELLVKIKVGALAATLAAAQKHRLLALAGRGHVAVHVAATTGRAWWGVFWLGCGVGHGWPSFDCGGVRASYLPPHAFGGWRVAGF